MSIHASGQMYPEIIYTLSQNKSYARAIDVGERLLCRCSLGGVSHYVP